ncbi:cupin domain-containing protein [Chryseobacterium sp. JUb7]|uniref:cupin domain-containing protein n=1 Tax=Chryseobacterium sp. JUb7 TaxID=2940599 RepID=UPI002169F5E5|nr:cupin domain-containing protein [Chryseobacterium sp. JUb7]MCS3531617.1 putative cupin superfamily sugar epimerase [Chryseobacterium sp. JUb7]
MDNNETVKLLEVSPDLISVVNMDGVYTCIKDADSRFVFCNENFAKLVGSSASDIVGKIDDRADHVKDDAAVRKAGVPLLNHREVIELPNGSQQPILTQKGLWRCPTDESEILGTTVNFSLQKTKEAWIKDLGLKLVDRVGYFGIDSTHEADKDSTYSLNFILIDNLPKLKLHKLTMDEQWFFHEGSALEIYIFDVLKKTATVKVLGRNIAKGEKLQVIVPKNTWFGAKVLNKDFNLSSCSLAPAFKEGCSTSLPEDDKERKIFLDHLKQIFPEYTAVIDELS